MKTQINDYCCDRCHHGYSEPTPGKDGLCIKCAADMTYFAAISSTGDGPAFGIGTTREGTRRDARKWIPQDEPIDDLDIVEITRASYLRIKAGYPDGVERAD